MNGKNAITELRGLVKEGKIEPEEAMIVLFGVNADLLENQHYLSSQVEESNLESKAREQRIIGKLKEAQEAITKSRKEDLEIIEKDVKEVKEQLKTNPMVRFGKFVREKPKHAATIGFALLAFSNVWFIDSFRRGVLLLLVPLGLPQEWVDIIAPLG